MHAFFLIHWHNLPLCSDWSNADEYGGCASYRSGECLHYSLHPPPSDINEME